MTNRNSQMPRSIKFQDNSFKNFVQSSSFLNLNSNGMIKQNKQLENNQYFSNTQANFNLKPRGFDYYNRNNLLLKSCNAEDIQYVKKNPVVFQEDIIVIPKKSVTQKNIPLQETDYKSKTMSNFNKPSQNKNDQVKRSKQAELNEFLFNYRKQEQEKKNKKLKFLQQVQNKLNNLQKQTEKLSDQKNKQFQQINGILKIQSDTTNFSKKADVLGKLNNALYQLNQQDSKTITSPKKITQDMELLQINAAIQDHHQYNDALLEQIQRVSRSKSKDRVKLQRNNYMQQSPKKTGFKKISDQNPQSSLSKTLKRSMQIPPKPSSGQKKLITTWKGKQ